MRDLDVGGRGQTAPESSQQEKTRGLTVKCLTAVMIPHPDLSDASWPGETRPPGARVGGAGSGACGAGGLLSPAGRGRG